MLRTIALIVASVICFAMQAQEKNLGSRAFMLGVGSSHQLDTYLSPRNYTGYQIGLLHEALRTTAMADSMMSFQSLWQGHFTKTANEQSTANYIGGHIAYDALWHYNWTPAKGLRLMAGGAVGADAGILYCTRGGNNPAQGRLSIDISASLMAIYTFRLGKKNFDLRYQANIPLVGVMFSPQFGQSYYDIYKSKFKGNICFSHPVNAFSLWQQLSADIPLGKYTKLRMGYLCDIRQSHVNSIKVHDWSHSFMIGFVRSLKR